MSGAEWEKRAHEVLSDMSAANRANKPSAANVANVMRNMSEANISIEVKLVSVWVFRNDSVANLSVMSEANVANKAIDKLF